MTATVTSLADWRAKKAPPTDICRECFQRGSVRSKPKSGGECMCFFDASEPVDDGFTDEELADLRTVFGEAEDQRDPAVGFGPAFDRIFGKDEETGL